MAEKSKNIVVAGSLAYDHIMTFNGLFRDCFIKEDIDNLSLSLYADTHDISFGGCSGNISFGLKVLGQSPILFGVAGNDFNRYKEWLETNDISTENIFIDKNSFTACANILTDKNQSQLTIFSPSAMKNHPVDIKLKDEKNVDLAIISPENPLRMIYLGKYFKKLGIPYVFDPGQSIPVFSSENLLELMKSSIGMILNKYEWSLVGKKIGLSQKEIANLLGFVVITCGENGCILLSKGKEKNINAVKNMKVVDSTGCGDAFRAGFLHSYVQEMNLEDCCEFGNSFASKTLSFKGTQNYLV